MSLSSAEHQQVQAALDSASPDDRLALKARAEASLAEANLLLDQGALTRDESKVVEIAVETLVRLEADAKGGGWWFRAKRRVQLLQMYLGE